MPDSTSIRPTIPPWFFAATYLMSGFMAMLIAIVFELVTVANGTGMQFLIAAVLACLADYLLLRAFKLGAGVIRTLSVLSMLPSLFILLNFLTRLTFIFAGMKHPWVD